MNRLFVLLGVGLFLAVLGGGAVVYVVEFDGKSNVFSKSQSNSVGTFKKRSFNIKRLKRLADKKSDPADFSSIDPKRIHEDREVVVVNPPKEFVKSIRKIGFQVLETQNFEELGLSVLRLRTPSGQSVRSARRTLLNKFPLLLIDLNHQFELS